MSLSHSTTATSSYILLKYSKSYPSQHPDQEWQHFVNPVIGLILDVKKASTGDLESVRLRIIWSMNSGKDSMEIDQVEVVFEDLDLLSFSSHGLQSQSQIQHNQSLPLKAVYRECVVGLRYLHSRALQPGNIPTYRRFQVTFSSAAAASQFVDSIRHVCPCKANSASVIPTIAKNPSTLQTTSDHLGRLNSVPPPSHPPIQQMAPPRTPLSRTPTSMHEILQSSPLLQHSDFNTSVSASSSPLRLNSGIDDRPSRLPSLYSHGASQGLYKTLAPNHAASHPLDAPTQFAFRAPPKAPSFPVGQSGQLHHPAIEIASGSSKLPLNDSNSLPNSSPPSSSLNSDLNPIPPPLPPSNTPQLTERAPVPNTIGNSNTNSDDEARSRFLASLQHAPDLYALSKTDLESLVSEVIREEGFLELVCVVSCLTTYRIFIP
ncbi:hypothetical protein JAAARDRAFT_687260 [Jaapia argillacea MUCL 33604]|uniref:Uncharacterized protein n=1 Tax=Jaapia argillacea MUCL 33604 TaxID=933084 RepID=A0A067PSC7_9AGAM|nr:hypothetical protein JAAARDRAFT_687260 [Jaapia argillacea MUCL 33604]